MLWIIATTTLVYAVYLKEQYDIEHAKRKCMASQQIMRHLQRTMRGE